MRPLQETKIKEIFLRDYYPLLEKLCCVRHAVRLETVKSGRTYYSFDGERYSFFLRQDGSPDDAWIGWVEFGKLSVGKSEGVYLWVWGKAVLTLDDWDEKIERKVRSHLNHAISEVLSAVVATRSNFGYLGDGIKLSDHSIAKISFRFPSTVVLTMWSGLKPSKRKIILRSNNMSELPNDIRRVITLTSI